MDEKKDYLENIKCRVNESEDDLTHHIIMPMLVNELGYKFYHCMNKKRISSTGKIPDILYQDNKGNRLVIEVKRPTESLDKHLYQVTGYLYNQNIEWGILTNGSRWILLNAKIRDIDSIGPSGRIVSDLLLKENRQGGLNLNDLKLFNFESIFKTGVTNYNKLHQQYKVYLINSGRRESTLYSYKTTINQFSSFLTHKYRKFVPFGHVDLEDISEFVHWYARSESSSSNRNKNKGSNNCVITVTTVRNIYRYLNTYFNILAEKGDITRNPLKDIRIKELIEASQDIITEEVTMDFSNIDEIVNQVYLAYEAGRNYEGVRNKAIFTLMLFGMDRKTISNAKLSDFDLSQNRLRVIDTGGASKYLVLTVEISKQIENVIKIKITKGIKSEWLFCSSTGQRIKEESISTEIVNKYLKRYSNLTIEAIRQYILRNLLLESRDIITLLFITGLDIKRFGDMLTWEDIRKLSDPKRIINKHPLKKFLV